MARSSDIAFLDYTFLFDPKDTWQHLYQFESTLADYLGERGLEAEIMESGNSNRRVLLIKKKVEVTPVKKNEGV